MMSLRDVLAFLELTDELKIVPWLAGSWGRQALQGTAGESAEDLDLFLDARDAPTLAQHLTLRGFVAVAHPPWHLVYRDRHGRVLDVRLFEREGDRITTGPDERWPATVLDGYGLLAERPVRVVRVPY